MLFGDVDWEGRGAGQSPCMGHSPCVGQNSLYIDGRFLSSGHSIGFHGEADDRGFIISTQGQVTA